MKSIDSNIRNIVLPKQGLRILSNKSPDAIKTIRRRLTAKIRKGIHAKFADNAESINLAAIALEIQSAKNAFGINSVNFACIPSRALRLSVLGNRLLESVAKKAVLQFITNYIYI